MTSPSKASTLQDVARVTEVEPLPLGDPRYVDLSEGRDTRDLSRLRIRLKDFANSESYAKFAFTGHRGCGKSTELLRMEHAVSEQFYPVHLFVDDGLLHSLEYTDLFLWIVDSVATTLTNDSIAVDNSKIDKVRDWFAEKIRVTDEKTKSEIGIETSVEAGGGFFGLIKLMARLKSSFMGSVERRTEIRMSLKNFATDLVARLDDLFDAAREGLKNAGKPTELLLVIDNLDRLPPPVGRELFLEAGDLLKMPRVHMIYTVPLPMVLAPGNITNSFESFTLPMVKMFQSDGKRFDKGRHAFKALLAARLELDRIFTNDKVVGHLIQMSGGSVRDLMRLVSYAQTDARTDDKSQIDMASVKLAVKKMRIEYEKTLIPGEVYYPILCRVHQRKLDPMEAGEKVDAKDVQNARDFFSQLLFNGSVLEYNGDRCWYDVHPIVQLIDAFQDKLKKLPYADADTPDAQPPVTE